MINLKTLTLQLIDGEPNVVWVSDVDETLSAVYRES